MSRAFWINKMKKLLFAALFVFQYPAYPSIWYASVQFQTKIVKVEPDETSRWLKLDADVKYAEKQIVLAQQNKRQAERQQDLFRNTISKKYGVTSTSYSSSASVIESPGDISEDGQYLIGRRIK